jgi:hypothetical protein
MRVKQNNKTGKMRRKNKGSLTFSPQMSISSSEGVNSMERGEAAVTRQNPAPTVQSCPEVGRNNKSGRTLLNDSSCPEVGRNKKKAEPCSTVQSCPEVGRNKKKAEPCSTVQSCPEVGRNKKKGKINIHLRE